MLFFKTFQHILILTMISYLLKCFNIILQSVVEFINDMPSFSEKNFSCFKPKNRQRRSKIIYISTKEGPPSQGKFLVIV